MDMIHRLRRKFLLLAFVAVVIILAGALGLINGITYMKMRSEVDTLLTAIVQNDGIMPSHQPGTSTESWLSDPEWYNDTPEFAHQTRYFSVILDHDGRIQRLNLSNISAFNELQALEIARALADGPQAQGVFKNKRASYCYSVTERPGAAGWWWSWTAPGMWEPWMPLCGIPSGSAWCASCCT